jgi:hypothetical protein
MTPTRAVRIVAAALAALVLALAAGRAPAQGTDQVRVFTRIDSNRLYLGEAGTLELRIEGAPDVDPPAPPAVPGLSIDFAGRSTFSQTNVGIVNGRRQRIQTSTLILSYRVTPSREGVFSIPAFEVEIGGETYRTGATPIEVTAPPVDERFPMELELEKRVAYVGEPVGLEIRWAFPAVRVSPPDFTVPGSAPFQNLAGPQPAARDTFLVKVDGEQDVGVESRGRAAGDPYGVLTVDRVIIPERPGELTIGPATASFNAVVGRRRSGFFSEDVVERRHSRAEPVRLEVRPLPPEGRPPGFDNLIGRFSVEAQASPTRVHVGDPIQLRVVVRGPEPLERVDENDLVNDPALEREFKLSPEGWESASGGPGSRVFTTTIRAATEAVREIPPIRLPFFDTDAEAYRVATTSPIPLEVLETRLVTADDAISAGLGADPIERLALETARPGVRANHVGLGALTSERGWAGLGLTSPAVIAVLLIPPAGCVFTVGAVLTRRARDPDEARRRGASRRALAALGGRGDPVERAARAVRVYLAARFGGAEGAITSHDARRLVGAFDPALAEQAAAVLRAAEAPGPTAGDAPTPTAVRSLIARIEAEAPR